MGFFDGEGGLHKLGKIVIRSLQAILGLTVAGIYGNVLNNELKRHESPNPAFTFAVVVAGLSCISALLFNIPRIKSHYVFAWDWLLTIFWLAIFGKYAQVFLGRDPNNPKQKYEGTDTQQMKNVVWIDLINMFLWLATASYGTFTFIRRRKQAKNGYADGGPQMAQLQGESLPWVGHAPAP